MGGGGLRAALRGPRGVEEAVILAVKGTAEEDTERGDRVGEERDAAVEGEEAMLEVDSEDSVGSKGSVMLTRV